MLKVLVVGVLALAAGLGAQGSQMFTGTITDSECDNGNHSRMRMGSNDAECVVACVDQHGAIYVLFEGRETYALSNQQTPEKFAGQKVTVKGTLDVKTKTIQVESIVAAR